MKISPIKIKNLQIKGNVFLAPLAGITDVGFRYVCRLSGAHLSYTEMVSAKGLYYKNENTERLLATEEIETPCAVQLFGSDKDIMAQACQNPLLQKFDIIDINMGCPVPKVVNNCEGSFLMQDIKTAEKVITACVKATDKPITVKFRKGFDDNNINAVEFAKMCEEAGALLVTVHGRLRTEYYSGKSDQKIIEAVKANVRIPVIASGDIFTAENALTISQNTGVDGVMVARGSLGNPQIFSQLTGTLPLTKYDCIIKQAATLLKHTNEKFTVLNMRKHLLWYLDTIGGKGHKVKAASLNTFSELESFVLEVFGDK